MTYSGLLKEKLLKSLEASSIFSDLPEEIKSKLRRALDGTFEEASNRSLFFYNKLASIKHTDVYYTPVSAWEILKVLSNNVTNVLLTEDTLFKSLKKELKNSIVSHIDNEINKIASPTICYIAHLYSRNYKITLEQFDKNYPILFEKIIYIQSSILENIYYSISKLFEDKNEIIKTFSFTFLTLKKIHFFDSDPHNGQKRVIGFVFNNGRKIIFKPRSLAGECYLNKVIEKIRTDCIFLPTIKILDKETYGWMEWIEENYSSNDINLAYQVGILLALCCTIGLTDLHAENVLLSKEGLKIIDAEAIGLMHPDLKESSVLRNPNVLDLGILPRPEGQSTKKWWDITLLGFTEGIQTIPVGIHYYKNNKTPKLIFHHLEKSLAFIKTEIFRQPKNKIKKEIFKAFKETVKVLRNLDIEDFKNVNFKNVRFVYRPTSCYIRTLLRLTDPKCGVDALPIINELLPYFDDLLLQIKQKLNFNFISILANEITSLVHGDVPRLTSLHLKSLVNNGSNIISWQIPNIEFSKKGIDISIDLKSETSAKEFTAKFDEHKIGESNFIFITSFLKRKIIVNKDNNNDIYGIVPNKLSGIPQLSVVEADLYNGLSGLYLMISVCNHFSKSNNEITSSIEKSISKKHLLPNNRNKYMSVTNGSLGILYSYSFLFKVTGNNKYLGLLDEVLNFFLADNDLLPINNCDVIGGLSGWLLILDAIPIDINSKKIKKFKETILNKILRAQTSIGAWASLNKKMMCGFSHGAAGIRYALGRTLVKNIGHEKRILTAMNKALLFEQKFYSYEYKNWCDFRYKNANERYSFFSAWCHGAAGIALSELGLKKMGLNYFDDRILPAYSNELVNYAIENNRTSICCGLGALYEISRIEKKYSSIKRITQSALLINSKNKEDNNHPISLFRSNNGLRFLDSLYQKIPNSPSLLLLE